jgi:Tol biopolymer transport system component
MSLDGNFVAVGSDLEVFTCDVNNSGAQPRKIMLSNRGNINSQRVNFSRDGKKVVVATRNVNGQTEIILYDRLESQEVWSRNLTKTEEIVSPRL